MMDCKDTTPTGQVEQPSFRMLVKAQTQRLRRIQMLCLPVLFVAFIGLMLTTFLELNGAFRACFTVLGLIAFLGEISCVFKVRNLSCPKCHKRIGYLLLNPYYSGKPDSAFILPDELPSRFHDCPYCHADWD